MLGVGHHLVLGEFAHAVAHLLQHLLERRLRAAPALDGVAPEDAEGRLVRRGTQRAPYLGGEGRLHHFVAETHAVEHGIESVAHVGDELGD